jgi:predicted Zn-dependent peptidase
MRKAVSRLSLVAVAILATSTTAALAQSNASTATTRAATATAPAAPTDRAVADLVNRIDVPFERFTLDNGLTVITHTDRKAPIVAVSVWYDVGSKDEPAGSTGFAHLFEHLMFNGTENAPGDFFEYLRHMGATDFNGTTNPDRTNYFETVPVGALDRTLFLEADRMGHLLGAVTQDVLDNQRGVVQNEKRQGDNQPYGLLRYYIFENLMPRGHPYHHSTIGSMADLNAASLGTVQNWFRQHYGPNNAVLVLAGDIDAATARPMVERWFGNIQRGPQAPARQIEIPTLPAPLAREVTDQVATPRIYRMWAVPGYRSEDATNLQVAASVLGGLSSSRLDNTLVRDEQIAVGVSSSLWSFEDIGIFFVQADVKPGVDVDVVSRRLDEVFNQYMAEGPTADEVRRVVMSGLSGQLDGLESVGGFGGKAVALAQSQLFTGDPGYFRTQLQRFAASTPQGVHQTMQRWLSRPVFSLTYKPGTRTDSGDTRGGAAIDPTAAAMSANYYRAPTSAAERAMGTAAAAIDLTADQAARPAPASTPAPAATPAPATAPAAPPAPAIQAPPLGEISDLDFPTIERGRLRNGIPVYFARRTAVPLVRVTVSFDAGTSSDPRDRAGLQRMMLNLMDEGTTTLNSRALAEAQERLGAGISTFATTDNSGVGLYALASNLRPSLQLWADVVRNPAFAPAEIERLRNQQLAGIAAELNSPQGLASRTYSPTLFGPHPYGQIAASGTVGTVRAITRDDLTAAHAAWIRPDNAAIYVVGDTDLRTVTSELNRVLGNWSAPSSAKGVKDFSVAIPAQQPRILLVNRPNSPQSIIVAGQVLGVRGRDDLVTLRVANDIIGGDFLSRINMDLRETKGWSYGSRSSVGGNEDRVAFTVTAPVQADKTGESIRAIQDNVRSFLTDRGVTAEELTRTVNGNIRELPGEFETSEAVQSGITSIIENGRPDNWYEALPARYRALTAQQVDESIRTQVDLNKFIYVVVGDAAVVRPQLEALNLPVEEVDIARLGGQ